MPHHVVSQPHPRFMRGIFTAGFATFLALVGHVLAGAPTPEWQGIAVPGVFAAFVGVLIAGRRAELWRLWIISAVAQIFFHTLFVLGTDTAVAHHAGHHEHHWSAAMVAAHAAAALGTALAQLHAERALLALVQFTYFVLSVVIGAQLVASGVAPRGCVCFHEHVPAQTSVRLSLCLFTRGPPQRRERYLLAA